MNKSHNIFINLRAKWELHQGLARRSEMLPHYEKMELGSISKMVIVKLITSTTYLAVKIL